MTVDLTLLRPGVKVRLRGAISTPQPRKPYPRGWREIDDVDFARGAQGRIGFPQRIRVVSDVRWLPVELIEEIRL